MSASSCTTSTPAPPSATPAAAAAAAAVGSAPHPAHPPLVDGTRFSIAPMMECTDRHYRFLARLLSKRALLYTEMIKDDTLLHRRDDLEWYLGHDPAERPLALQLGGSDPRTLAAATALV